MTSKDILKKHSKYLDTVNIQRRWWLIASSIVYISTILLILLWDWISNLHMVSIWWGVISMILIITINWWYWTMHIIHKLINDRTIEIKMILFQLLSNERCFGFPREISKK